MNFSGYVRHATIFSQMLNYCMLFSNSVSVTVWLASGDTHLLALVSVKPEWGGPCK